MWGGHDRWRALEGFSQEGTLVLRTKEQGGTGRRREPLLGIWCVQGSESTSVAAAGCIGAGCRESQELGHRSWKSTHLI